jgi:hypothetical protein
MTRQRFGAVKELLLILLILAVGIYGAGTAGLSVVEYFQDTKVSSDAGAARSSSLITGLFRDQTQVITDKWTYLVNGDFPIVKGDRLMVVERKNGWHWLCNHNGNDCNTLAE